MLCSAFLPAVLLQAALAFAGLQAIKDAGSDVKAPNQYPQPAEIVSVLKSHIVEATSFKDHEIDIRLNTDLKNLELPAGNISYRTARSFIPSSYRNVQLPIEAWMDGKPLRTFFVAADVTIRAKVVQTARRISYGAALSHEDLRLEVIEISHPRMEYLRGLQDALGKVVRHGLSAGVPLTRDDLADPILIKSGETVQMRLDKDGIRLAMLGRAEQSGRLGQYIRVKNLDFSQTIRARVTGRGEVMVE